MKLRNHLILLFTMICGSAGLFAQPSGSQKGDVTGDGAMNVLDAVRAVHIILGIEPAPGNEELCTADCNGDGTVDILDVVGIVNAILEVATCVASCDELNCDDGNSCTDDHCDSLCVGCRHTSLAADTTCDDGDLCTDDDRCVNGQCQGTPRNCSDRNACTEDSCDPGRGCLHREICCGNGLDDDQDGSSDCNDGDCLTDSDNDGYFSPPCGHDLDDDDPDINPGATEICDDDKDNDCNGYADCEDSVCLADPVCLECGTVMTDIDGNTYQTIQIGSQCWMAENLKVTHYRNGEAIPELADWCSVPAGAWCVFGNDADNAVIYGRLYNWYAVEDSKGLAPRGWHVPSDEEWQILVEDLGGFNVAGGKMKATGTIEAGTGLWHAPNNGATNESGFSALPAGYRSCFCFCFDYLRYGAYFWSSTEEDTDHAWKRSLNYLSASLARGNASDKQAGYSVRCVKDKL